ALRLRPIVDEDDALGARALLARDVLQQLDERRAPERRDDDVEAQPLSSAARSTEIESRAGACHQCALLSRALVGARCGDKLASAGRTCGGAPRRRSRMRPASVCARAHARGGRTPPEASRTPADVRLL